MYWSSAAPAHTARLSAASLSLVHSFKSPNSCNCNWHNKWKYPTSTEFHILGRAVWQSSAGTLPASLPSLVGCSLLITYSEQDLHSYCFISPGSSWWQVQGSVQGRSGGTRDNGTCAWTLPLSRGGGRGGAGRGGWPLWHCAGPRAGHQHPATYPRYPRPDTRAMRCFLMLRVALLVLLMPRVRGQDVRNKLLHGKTDETILYGKETGNENMWQIALKYLKFVQTLKFCQSPPTFEYANHRSHHFTIPWRLFRALYNKKYICIYVAHNFNNVRKSQYVNIWSKFWVLPLGRSIHNGYTFSMFSIEFSRFPPHYCIQDPMAASGEISPKLGKCPLPPPSPFPPEYEWSWTNGWNWLSLIPFIVRLFLFTIYLSKTEEKTGVPSSADAQI